MTIRMTTFLAAAALMMCACGGSESPAAATATTAATPAEATAGGESPAPAAGSTEAVLAHHLQAFGEGNMEQILADYTDASQIVTPMGTLKGTEAIKGLFTALFAEFGKPGMSFDLALSDVRGEVAFIVWKAETADNTYELGTDTFVVRDGKIVHQTFAGKITPKSPPPAAAEAAAPATPAAPAAEPVDGSTGAVMGHHLKAFGERNMADIMSDYSDDAVLFSQNGPLEGKEAIQGLFTALFAEFAKPGAKMEMKKTTVEGEIGYVIWSGESADNVYAFGTDTFVVQNGKITAQSFAGVITPKAAAAAEAPVPAAK